jgi:hypothetical protein
VQQPRKRLARTWDTRLVGTHLLALRLRSSRLPNVVPCSKPNGVHQLFHVLVGEKGIHRPLNYLRGGRGNVSPPPPTHTHEVKRFQDEAGASREQGTQ